MARLVVMTRRIGARAEALASGYVTADIANQGGEEAAKAALLVQIRELAIQSGAVEIKKG